METLFEIEPVKPMNGKTCKDCAFRQRWECNSVVVQYCGVRKSNRTNNGLLKIKCKSTACNLFKKINN